MSQRGKLCNEVTRDTCDEFAIWPSRLFDVWHDRNPFFFFFTLSINVRILYEQPAFTAREVHRFWWKFWRRRIWRGCSTGLGLKQALVSRLTSRYKVTLIKMPPLLSFIFFWHLITRDKIVIKIHRLNERFKDKRMRYKLTDSSHTMIYNENNHPFHANLC